MSSANTSDFIVQRLAEWGVRRIYGYPGDGINGIMGALGRAERSMRFVQVRHEEMAAFMACAHAKFTGEVGICLATSGPGAIHLLNGLYDAKMDHQPVVAIVGQQARAALGGSYQQEVDLVSLFKDVAGDFVQQAAHPAQIRHLIDRAVRIARSRRTVTCVIIPNDLQELPAEPEPPRRARHRPLLERLQHAARHPGGRRPARRRGPSSTPGSKVAILVGAGALGASARGRARGRGARRRSREGAARQGGAARRPAVGDRAHRPARDQAELEPDAGVRHAADHRLELPLLRVPAQGGAGARDPDRPRRRPDRDPLPHRAQPRRRQRRDPARPAAPARAQGRPRLAGPDRRLGGRVVEGARRPRAQRGETRSTRSCSSGSCRRACRTPAS